MKLKLLSLCLAVLLASFSSGQAAIVSYIFFGTGAGLFDGVPFGNSDFTFLLIGDPAAITPTPNHYTLQITQGSFSRGGSNTFALAEPGLITLSTQPGALSIGFTNLAFTSGFQILNQPTLANYDLAGFFRTGIIETAADLNVDTGGSLALVGNQAVALMSISRLSFSATPLGGETSVPEPAAGLLLASACGWLLLVRTSFARLSRTASRRPAQLVQDAPNA